ncbi:MAG TPA: protein kinase [Gemmatimonadaceae bacterium]|nr:protein kinase [Gemmatimonadaceae bacterium]
MLEASQLGDALAGRYEVEREIGRGGMATVFLARDVRHQRPVAIKLLDPELGAVLGVERFLAEIQVTANLQHPNLLPLFDSGQTAETDGAKGGFLYYVMPYVEGESLRARLDRERQLPVEEAVRIAVAIASALDYAHDRGVIHRDLKPENILLQAGEPVVADFGIALAVSKAGGERVTQTGLSLGTPQYMSPEQATGDRVIDRRADIYSLAAMTYEMLTGEPPHIGATMQAVIARLLTETPRPVRTIRPSVPDFVDAAVERGLEKLPADRWSTAREFADALRGKAASIETRSARMRASSMQSGWRASVANPAVLALGLVAVVALGYAVQTRSSARAAVSTPRPTVRFPLTLPSDVQLSPSVTQSMIISRDGSTIAYIASGPTGGTQIYLRSLNDPASRPVPGTERAISLFFSPDAKWLAYDDGGFLMKRSLESGSVFKVAQLSAPYGGAAWTDNGIMLIGEGKIVRVPENGGALQPLCKSNRDSLETQVNPYVLPDNDKVVFDAFGAEGIGQSKLYVASLSTGICQPLGVSGLQPIGFVRDQLIYVTSGGVVTAVSFDVRRGKTTSAPVPLATDVVVFPSTGTAQAALSATGTLITQSGVGNTQLTVADLAGHGRALAPGVRAYSYPRLSPDGTKIAATVSASALREIVVYDIGNRTTTRVTAADGVNDRPEWSADGTHILYRSSRAAASTLWWRRADLSAPEQMLLGNDRDGFFEGVIAPDGKTLVYQIDDGDANLRYRLTSGDTTSHAISETTGTESQARVSPDGKWIAFVTSESSRDEVVVQPFPGPGAVTPVSVNGGREPVWSRDGKKLFYRDNLSFIAANVRTSPTFSVVSRDTLFRDRFARGAYHANYDVMPDGAHLLVLEAMEQAQLIIAHNWADEVLTRLRARKAQ